MLILRRELSSSTIIGVSFIPILMLPISSWLLIVLINEGEFEESFYNAGYYLTPATVSSV